METTQGRHIRDWGGGGGGLVWIMWEEILL